MSEDKRRRKSIDSSQTIEEEREFLLLNIESELKENQEDKKKSSDTDDLENRRIENIQEKIFNEIKKEAVDSFIEIKSELLQQYLEFRDQLLKGRRLIRMISQISTINIFLIGFLKTLYGLLSFNPTLLLMSLYTVLISINIFLLEIPRNNGVSKLQSLIRSWFKFLELSTGRGIFQILLSNMTFYITYSIYFRIAAFLLGFAGMLNIIFGILAASKLRKIINLLKHYGSKDIENLNHSLDIDKKEFNKIIIDKERDPEYKLKKIHRLFEALDEDGNGYIDKEELFNGLSSLKLPFEVSLSEVDIIFEHLDKDKNDKISVKEFEYWFISKKCPYLIL